MIRPELTHASFAPRWPLVTCLALLLAVPLSAVAQSRFSGIVVFGTSLSDSGNAFALVGDAGTPPDFTLNPLLIPTCAVRERRPSFQQRRDVGRAVREVRRSGPAASGRPWHRPISAATNFAVGAARAYDDGVNFNLTRQVDTFLATLRRRGVARCALRHRDGRQRHPRCVPDLCDRRQRGADPRAGARLRSPRTSSGCTCRRRKGLSRLGRRRTSR